MTLQWAVLMILIIATGISIEAQHQSQNVSDYATLDSIGRNFLIYRSAAAGFAQSNPGFSGTPNDSALNLPQWFVRPVGVSSYIAAGTTYTYFTGVAPAGMPSKLVDLTQSTVVGVKRSGVLISPVSGATGITIPPAVPEGAIVAVN
ncbi:type IV pilus biogenesis protein PilM [Pseudomonas tolaasii]|uniref:type IV pilus biogenesis protein PilM n=1 Tax=Pseudomonas tolaasii TaxID=29442 RepID=UPI000365DF53|nr:type IV pilus biogenesis protein PilM [Pseudomonas tolaasii]